VLGRYTDPSGASREIVARPGAHGSVLVIDRDASTLGDRRLVAHLAADEPLLNAAIVCDEYLRDPAGRRCRRVVPDDLRWGPFAGERGWADAPRTVSAAGNAGPGAAGARAVATNATGAGSDAGRVAMTAANRLGADLSGELRDRHGFAYSLRLCPGRTKVSELRWSRRRSGAHADASTVVSLREVLAALESYEPARTLTVAALARHAEDERVSLARLHGELRRSDASSIVLNRGLREAVLAAVRTQGLSLSQIAARCGRVKHDGHGCASGETSWLTRRVGLRPQGGEGEPTPWVHSDVLALIARRGLGLCPREVELG
jgi:hypothetical protein